MATKLVTITRAAELLGTSEANVRQLLHRGRLSARRLTLVEMGSIAARVLLTRKNVVIEDVPEEGKQNHDNPIA